VVAPLNGGRGVQAAHLRRTNERLVLQCLRRTGEASKADLARATHLTSAAVGGIITDLERMGLIETVGKRQGARGQPATLMKLNPTGAYGIGVRLDRAAIETALVDFTGSVLDRRMHDTVLPAPEDAIALILGDITKMLSRLPAHHRSRIAGIGLAQPFNLEAWLSELDLPAELFRRWRDVDLRHELERELHLSVTVENDGNAATIAELFHGLGQAHDDFLYLYIGAAIGGGVVIGGDCLTGSRGNGGDVAMMLVPPSRLASAAPPRGAHDILISRASLKAMDRHLKVHGQTITGMATRKAAVEARAFAVSEWLDDCVDALIPAILNASALLDAPLVVIDSDLGPSLLDTLVPKVKNALATHVPEARQAPDVVAGTFGPDAGAIGAATIPMFFSFAPRASTLARSSLDREGTDHVALV
jgi:predicted NBD/HSP70 family sugar kinase